jgi:hypothetical protein
MVRKRKKKSGSFRRRALKSARMRKAKELRLKARGYTAKRVRLDRGGYDSSGQYFGSGAPLYEIDNEDERFTGYVRAHSSAEAKEEAIKRPGYWGIRHW